MNFTTAMDEAGAKEILGGLGDSCTLTRVV